MIVVSDTSSVSALIRINHIHLLRDLYEDVRVPDAVAAELGHLHPSLPAWMKIEAVADRNSVDNLKKKLGAGESEAIVLSEEKHADLLLIDDRRGRRIAMERGIHVIGLLAVLLEAKKQTKIISVREILERLEKETTFRISVQLKESTIKKSGE
ncbi:MAG: hypothetical protein A3G34_01700 [Candidatus Lindowbacteria bacterium RIFCSPLOWO2_12_FULL_62_27]|nr:MAG: hypothetical protein A3I06_05645 [Candidatus Lindowbacteria bacterium RIFCSPLOWO2_02_FULL_62_12]OGH59025.1 MAG: hypothetical protein A3G34_01700 [Candidatus Lindowbacteria bacterium RIFCSPLOWO2_12_FULL_62_27]